jgi:hypothetical protein
MISCTESKRAVNPRNESFGLVVDDLVETVTSAEKSSQAEAVRTESLWQYDIGSDEWRMISQLVGNVVSRPLEHLDGLLTLRFS